MLVELYVFFEIIAIGIFIASFFTKQEILWAISLALFGVLMFMSFNVEYYVYQWNATISAYYPVAIAHSYPYLMGINSLFFALSLVLLLFDIFDKYGSKLTGKG
jgi:hypothetical protein